MNLLDTSTDNSLEEKLADCVLWNDKNSNSLTGVPMGTVAGAQQILAGLKEAGIDLVASVPDINML